VAYVLGHSDRELRRLAFQAELIAPITRQLLVEAGIGSGMRVLDVGTGRGDVAFLAAELVGETGAVVGFDRSREALEIARERAAAAGIGNVSFEVGDAAEVTFEHPFDAVVGRYVLEFQPDAGGTLRRLASSVRPGGIVAFHEIDWRDFRSYPPVPIWERCGSLTERALTAGGADTHVGTKLAAIFAAAGLEAPTMRMTTLVGVGAASAGVVQRLMGIFLSLLPRMEELGLVERGEFDPETIEQQVLDEIAASGSAVIECSELTARARRHASA
jgi:SAM-dependent methyltransferase